MITEQKARELLLWRGEIDFGEFHIMQTYDPVSDTFSGQYRMWWNLDNDTEKEVFPPFGQTCSLDAIFEKIHFLLKRKIRNTRKKEPK